MKKTMFVIISALLVSSCSPGKKNTGEKAPAVFDPTPVFCAIEKERQGEKPSFAVIDSLYTAGLSAFVKSTDPLSDSVIAAAVANAKKGADPEVNSELVNKTIQKVFFNDVMNCLETCAGESDSGSFFGDITKIDNDYGVLSPTVIRRSAWIGKERELDDMCRMHIRALKSSFNDKPEKEKGLETLRNALKQAFALSVLFELEGIAENRGKDNEKCKEKEVEGRTYFEIVGKYAGSDSLKSLIQSGFAKGYEDMDIEKMQKMVSEAFNVGVPEKL